MIELFNNFLLESWLSNENKRLVVTGDFLRVASGVHYAKSSCQNGNILWMYRLMRQSLSMALGCQPEPFLWTSDGSFDGTAFYRSLQRDASAESWIQTYEGTDIPPNLIDIFDSCFSNCLIIGFELSPLQRKTFSLLNIPFLSFAIHPIRFCRDYFFQAETNVPQFEYAIQACRIPEYVFKISADIIFAETQRKTKLALDENSVLLCGQVDVDAALIHNSSILSLDLYYERLELLSKQYKTLYFKPHPYDVNPGQVLDNLRRYANVALINRPIYEILSQLPLLGVAAISSSVLSEAVFFNKERIAFHPKWKCFANEPALCFDAIANKFWMYATKNFKKLDALTTCLSSDVIKQTLNINWEIPSPGRYSLTDQVTCFLGKTIHFTKIGGAQKALDDQWWEPESWGTWSKVGQSRVCLSFAQPVSPSGVKFRIEFKAFACADSPVALSITVGNAILFAVKLQDSELHTEMFIVPAFLIDYTRSLVLTFVTSGGGSVLSRMNNDDEADARALAVGLISLEALPVDNHLPCNLHEKISFAAEETGFPALGDGWARQESSGVWSEDREAHLRLRFVHHCPTDVVLRFANVSAFVSDLLPLQTVRFCVGQEELLTVNLSQQTENINILVPRRLLCDNMLDLVIHVLFPHSPADAGISDDARKLGIFIRDLTVESALTLAGRSTVRHGMTIIGPHNIVTGLGVMTRNVSEVLRGEFGEDFVTCVNFNDSLHGETNRTVCGYQSSKYTIVCGDVVRLKKMIQASGTGFLKTSYTICYGAWELEEFPDYLTDTAHIDEYWALSDFIAKAASRRMSIPVFSMPLPVISRWPGTLRTRANFGLPEKSFLFLFTFCADSTLTRKNPFAVIQAFQKAFPDTSRDVGLVFKCKIFQADATTKAHFEKFKRLAATDPRIFLIESQLSDDDNASLYINTDAYISLHRAEGFGLTIAEAMSYGKPVIATAYSGNLDFMNQENSCLVDYDLVKMNGNEYHGQQLRWADARVDHAASYMRRLYDDEVFRHTIARQGKFDIASQFSPEIVGQRFRRRLEELEGGAR